MKIIKGNSGDSVLLAIVKAFTTISGILSTMIVSHALSLELYGTYSQTALITTTATNIFALGLVDAVNYFYNRSQNPDEKEKYVNTVMGFQSISGIVAAVLIIALSSNLISYFNNELLHGYFILIAFRPLFANLNVSLQYLQVSIGRAKAVAARNAIFATLRLIVFSIAAYILKDISVILISFLAFEIVITIYFEITFAKKKFWVVPYKIDWSKTKEILVYSIPMGIYVLTNSLNRDIDKMLIGGWFSTDQYAIYANCATLLPFDIVSASFLTVLVPILTRYFGNSDYHSGQKLFKNYLKIGYYTSFTFTVVSIVLSRQMVLFLYGDKYISGQSIFVLYTIVDMVKFANMSIVLASCGKTKTLMICSLSALVANTVLNILFYHVLGFIGPAIATVVVTVALTIMLANMSAKSLRMKLISLIEWKEMLLFAFELLITGFICNFAIGIIDRWHLNYMVIIIVIGLAFMGTIFALNRKKIISAMREINSLH